MMHFHHQHWHQLLAEVAEAAVAEDLAEAAPAVADVAADLQEVVGVVEAAVQSLRYEFTLCIPGCMLFSKITVASCIVHWLALGCVGGRKP